MHSDIAIEIGNSHRICEDYGRANNSVPQYPFVIICDGCSDPKSPDVDFGARILAKTAERFILLQDPQSDSYSNSNMDFLRPILERSFEICKNLELHPQSLDCTLMVARAGSRQIQIDCWGDGNVIAVQKSGLIEVYGITYPLGYPFYPNYYLDESRMKCFKSFGKKMVNHYTIALNADPVLISSTACDAPDTHLVFNVADYNYIAITSDGLWTFYTDDKLQGRQSISVVEIIRELAGFKNGTGQFVQRRFNAFMKNLRRNYLGISHYDDITVGAICLENNAKMQ